MKSILLLFVLGTLACSEGPEPPPLVWEGEHLRFGTDADDSIICGGTMPYLDHVTGYLGEVLGRPDVVVDYYWVPGAVDDYCEADAWGCSSEGRAFSRYVVHQHELVHSVRAPDRAYLPFDEGLADAFGDDWNPAPYVFEGEIDDLLRHPSRHFPGNGYALAGHFVSFLRVTHGVEPLLELSAATGYESTYSGTARAFERIFGSPLDDAIAEYEASYPECPMRVYRDKTADCDRNVVPAPTVEGEQVEHVIPLDCDDPTVIGPRFDARWNTASIEVEVEGRYYVTAYPEVEVYFADLTSCDVDCFGYGDDGFSLTTGTEIGFGHCFEPGRYLVRYATDTEEQGGVQLYVSFTEARECD